MKYNRSAGFLIFLAAMTSYAAPFTLTPQGTLPTSVIQGSSVNASYTVTNNTLLTRSHNFVKWFPPHVTQVLEPTNPRVCSRTFNLGPHGSINQSCTLKLKISGAVNRNDSNPQHHLFVCLPGGKTCAGPTPANSLNVRIGSGSVTKISTAVGVYQSGIIRAPLAFKSSNNGESWSASLPPSADLDGGATLFGVGCSGERCSAVGVYGDNNSNELPFSYSSSDAGATWSEPYFFSLQGMPVPGNTEILTVAISCSGSNCSTVGSYQDNSNRHQPLSYSSSNYGVSWSMPYFPSTVGLPASQSRFLGTVSCTGTTCVAGGFFDDASSDRQPLFYRSTNNGVTWSAPIIPSTTGLPSGYVGGARIISVSCAGANCTAIGEVDDPLEPKKPLPFSYLSTNGGLTWSTAHLFSLAGLPAGNIGAFMDGVSCVENKCTAVGYYITSTSKKRAVYYTSDTRGASWSGPLFPPRTGIPSSAETVMISVSCINNICSSAGSYIGIGSSAVTYHSINNGRTWTIFIPSLSPLPVNANSQLFGVGGSQSGILIT